LSQTVFRAVGCEKQAAEEFRLVESNVNADRRRRARVLVGASRFGGWKNFRAFEMHAGFVKTHQMHVRAPRGHRGRDWQEWLVETLRMFLHPQARAFDPAHASDAPLSIA